MIVSHLIKNRVSYEGSISNSIAAYYVGLEPQEEKVMGFTLPDWMVISLTCEGYLNSFEFLDLRKTRLALPRYALPLKHLMPIFEIPTEGEKYQWSCYRENNSFAITMNDLAPDIEYRVGNISFYCYNKQLTSIEARDCEITE